MEELSINQLMIAIMKVDPTAYLNYELTSDGTDIGWAIYAEGHSPNKWHQTTIECLRAYASELKTSLTSKTALATREWLP